MTGEGGGGITFSLNAVNIFFNVLYFSLSLFN